MPVKRQISKKPLLSVILPVFNEESSLPYFLPKLKNSLDSLGISYELIAVDDGSSDNSYKILQNFSFLKILRHFENLGYGAALKTGIRHSSSDWILIIDADGTYNPEEIKKLWGVRKSFDMVVGSRTGQKVHIPLMRIPAKTFLKVLSEYVIGKPIPDLNSGFRLFKKNVCKKYWGLYPKGFSFTTTLTIIFLANGYLVKFVPINYEKRIGKSTIDPIRDFIGFVRLVLKLMLYFRPLKIFLPLGLFFLVFSFGVYVYDLITFGRILHDTTLIFSFFISINTFMLGLIADLIARK